MILRKNLIFYYLFLKREFPLFKTLILGFLISLSFSLVFNNNYTYFKNSNDISLLIKVINIPNRNKVGEISFIGSVYGEIVNNEDEIKLKYFKNSYKIYCKAIELPWKNIINLEKNSLIIARGKLNNFQSLSSGNFKNYLKTKSISGFFKIKYSAINNKTNDFSLKLRFQNSFNNLFSSSEISSLFHAMLLGEKTGLSKKLEFSFRKLGLSHLLVVSGFHISLIFFLFRESIRFLLRRIYILKYYFSLNLLSNLLALFIVLIFCIISGFKPSALRAFLAILAYCFYERLGFKANLIHLLSLYLLFFTLFSSNLFNELGVQYTFLALLGIAFGSAFKINNKIIQYFIVTSFATAFTSVLTLMVFNKFSLFAFISNALLSPILIILICKSGLILLILSEINLSITKLISYFLEIVILNLIDVIKLMAEFEFLNISYPSLVGCLYLLIFIILTISYLYYFIRIYRLKYNL